MKSNLTYPLIFILSLLLQACAGINPALTEKPEADTIVLRVGALNVWIHR